jgi:predicted DNA-binding antitoxin AbrB/MazE fold protein
MVRQVEAIFENGVLRSLEPLALAEKQHVRVTITDGAITDAATPDSVNHRYAEMAWLAAHEREYAGQWLALDGDTLLSHGSDAHAVREEARRRGVDRPLMFHVPEEEPWPFQFDA